MSPPARAALAAAFVLAWSSGFVGAELATATAGTATVLAWRFLVAAPLLLVPALLVRRLAPTWRQVRFHAGIGLLAQCGYLGGVVLAIELGVPSGTTALIAALQPIVATAAAGSLLGERVSGRQWAGLWVGLGGVAVVVGGDLSVAGPPWPAYLLPLGAMLSLVVATLAERHGSRAADPLPLVTSVGIQSAVSAVLFSGVALASGAFTPPPSAGFAFAISWVVLLSTFGGYGLYWLVLRTSGVARVSSLLYLTPPVTMLSGALLFGDPVSATTVAGTVVCLTAVWLVQRPAAGPVVGPFEPAGWQVSSGGRPVTEIRPLRPCSADQP